MKSKLGLTDLVFTLLFPEVEVLRSAIAGAKGITRLSKREMQKVSNAVINQLPKLSLSSLQIKKLEEVIKNLIDPFGTLESVRSEFLADPGKLGQRFGTLSKDEKIKLSEELGEYFDIGIPDAATLSSSAVSRGIYTPTSAQSGNLELTFINGGTYTYPGVPMPIWEEMKAATGRNGSGAYTIFYYGYWRAASGTKGSRQISTAFRLAGIGR